ncbi:unnamed protein product [Urochloa humidicola]
MANPAPAGRRSLVELAALDSARTQMYHLKAIAIAGIGFFKGAYEATTSSASPWCPSCSIASLLRPRQGGFPPAKQAACERGGHGRRRRARGHARGAACLRLPV